MKRTTDLQIVKKFPNRFAWGNIKKIWEIGSYAIGEYNEDCLGKLTRTFYHVWIDGKDESISADTLEGALATAMAHKHDGINSQAGMFFTRMIGIKEEQ